MEEKKPMSDAEFEKARQAYNKQFETRVETLTEELMQDQPEDARAFARFIATFAVAGAEIQIAKEKDPDFTLRD